MVAMPDQLAGQVALAVLMLCTVPNCVLASSESLAPREFQRKGPMEDEARFTVHTVPKAADPPPPPATDSAVPGVGSENGPASLSATPPSSGINLNADSHDKRTPWWLWQLPAAADLGRKQSDPDTGAQNSDASLSREQPDASINLNAGGKGGNPWWMWSAYLTAWAPWMTPGFGWQGWWKKKASKPSKKSSKKITKSDLQEDNIEEDPKPHLKAAVPQQKARKEQSSQHISKHKSQATKHTEWLQGTMQTPQDVEYLEKGTLQNHNIESLDKQLHRSEADINYLSKKLSTLKKQLVADLERV